MIIIQDYWGLPIDIKQYFVHVMQYYFSGYYESFTFLYVFYLLCLNCSFVSQNASRIICYDNCEIAHLPNNNNPPPPPQKKNIYVLIGRKPLFAFITAFLKNEWTKWINVLIVTKIET